MRNIVTALVLAISSPILLAGQAGAQKVITPPPADQAVKAPEQPASQPAAVEDIRPNGAPIVLGVSLGTLLHLPSDASIVFIANPDIADVHVEPADYIYITAKKPGTTVLYAEDKLGHLMLNRVVQVKPMPVAIIRRGTLDTGEAPAPPNFLVLPLQPQAAPAAAATR